MDISLMVYFSLALFIIGLIGVLTMRNALILFLSIEIMLNASNLLFVAFSRFWGNQIGLVWIFFVFVIAAVEAAVGLAILIRGFRHSETVDVDRYNVLRG